jgi:hypothetical protein
MQLCEICKEPAARRVTSGRDGQTVTTCYCYVHAADAGLLEVPLDEVNRAAIETGYAVNAVIFVLESLIRTGYIGEVETAEGVSWTAKLPKSPLEVCVAVSRAAVEQFHQQAGLALNYWKLTRGKDVGFVLSCLIRSGFLSVSLDSSEEVLRVLSAMDGPLVT